METQAAALELQCERVFHAPPVLAALLFLRRARADRTFVNALGRVLLLQGAFILKNASWFQWQPFCFLLAFRRAWMQSCIFI